MKEAELAELPPGSPIPGSKEKSKRRPFRMFADFDTNLGKFRIRLYHLKAPKTVDNFVGLAEGTVVWIDPKTGEKKLNKPYFDGLIFHRVIKGFMIQGGDPKGDGTGGPGYEIKDEFDAELRHDREGILSMANRGPNTGGSQFFITLGPAEHLDDRHAVFGEVDSGMEVVRKIGAVATDRNDRPRTPVTINKVSIVREMSQRK
jgi:peptidyl-prolyl cis-trans isomerase A (cyclophilin A)